MGNGSNLKCQQTWRSIYFSSYNPGFWQSASVQLPSWYWFRVTFPVRLFACYGDRVGSAGPYQCRPPWLAGSLPGPGALHRPSPRRVTGHCHGHRGVTAGVTVSDSCTCHRDWHWHVHGNPAPRPRRPATECSLRHSLRLLRPAEQIMSSSWSGTRSNHEVDIISKIEILLLSQNSTLVYHHDKCHNSFIMGCKVSIILN